MIEIKGQWYLGSTPVLIGILDNLQSWYSVLTYSKMCDMDNRVAGFSYYSHSRKIKTVLEQERTRLGEKFFDLLASWEPLVVGYVVSDTQDDLGFTPLYKSVFKRWKEELNVADEIIELLVTTDRNHPLHRQLALEFIGIQKMFGHPFLSVEEGIKDIKTRGTEILP